VKLKYTLRQARPITVDIVVFFEVPMSCEVLVSPNAERCEALEAGRKLVDSRKQQISSRNRPTVTDNSNDRGFYLRVEDLSNDRGIHPKNPVPSQEEVVQLGRAFLDAKKAAVGAILAIDPSLASSKDPLADFARTQPLLASKFFDSPSSDLSQVAKAAKAALEKDPENKPLAKFAEAYQKFTDSERRMNSQYFHMAL